MATAALTIITILFHAATTLCLLIVATCYKKDECGAMVAEEGSDDEIKLALFMAVTFYVLSLFTLIVAVST